VPGSDNSGGRTRSKRSRAGNRYLKLAFSHAGIRATQRYAEVGAAYRKKLRKKNKPLAQAWVRQQLARIVSHVLKKDVDLPWGGAEPAQAGVSGAMAVAAPGRPWSHAGCSIQPRF
jgi:hypothetical protein